METLWVSDESLDDPSVIVKKKASPIMQRGRHLLNRLVFRGPTTKMAASPPREFPQTDPLALEHSEPHTTPKLLQPLANQPSEKTLLAAIDHPGGPPLDPADISPLGQPHQPIHAGTTPLPFLILEETPPGWSGLGGIARWTTH